MSADIVYFIIGCCGVILNIIVSVGIFVDESMQSATHKFMAHLSVLDAITLLVRVVIPFVLNLFEVKVQLLTATVDYFVATSLHTGICFLILISVSRWMFFLKKCMDTLSNKTRLRAICAFCWIFLHLLYFPFFFIFPDAFRPLSPTGGGYKYTNNTYSTVLAAMIKLLTFYQYFFPFCSMHCHLLGFAK